MLLEMVSQEGWTALTYASYQGHNPVAALLLDRGADIEARTNVSVWHASVWLHWRLQASLWSRWVWGATRGEWACGWAVEPPTRTLGSLSCSGIGPISAWSPSRCCLAGACAELLPSALPSRHHVEAAEVTA